MLLKLEFQKIWKPKILLIIAVMGLLFGFLFLEFPLNYFPNGPQCEEQYRLMQDWTKKYGTEMDAAEYRAAREELKNRLGVTEEMVDGSVLVDYASKGDEYLQQRASALYEYELRYEKLNKYLEEQIMIFAVLYARLGTWHFWNNPINSFFYGDVYWFDLSFGQYLMVILLLIVLFTGSAAGVAFSLSCLSRNYISLMLKIIPAFFVLGILSNQCISYLLSFDNPLYQLTGVKGMEIYVGVTVLLLGAAFSLVTLKYKSRIRDNDIAV